MRLLISMCVLVVGGAVSCKAKETARSEASAQASATPPPAVPKEVAQKQVNPGGEPTYSGPSGTVRGIVKVTGDRAPEVSETASQIKGDNCEPARQMYTRLFREGSGRTLADVLVGVTGYKGYVPAPAPAVVVHARGCAFDRRTVAMTYGQTLEVLNKDGETYIPQLLGSNNPALLVAMPGGDPVRLNPTEVGQYAVVDRTHEYAKADVFVVRFSTHDVTAIDGKFEIPRVPAGEVRVSAFSPAIGQTVEKRVTVPAGSVVDVDFEIAFDAKAVPPASGSASAAPPSSGAPAAGN